MSLNFTEKNDKKCTVTENREKFLQSNNEQQYITFEPGTKCAITLKSKRAHFQMTNTSKKTCGFVPKVKPIYSTYDF